MLHVVPSEHGPRALARHRRRGRDQDVARDAPVAPIRGASGGRRAGLDQSPVVGEERPGEKRARHRDPPALAGHAHRARARGAGRHRDRRMRPLVGLHVVAAALHRIEHGRVDVEELSPVREPAVGCPELEHDVEHLGRAGTNRRRLQTEQREVRWDAAAADAPLKPATGHVVEHGQPVREVDRIVQSQQGHAGPEPHGLRQRQRLGEQQIGGRRVFPALREVLAHPDLAEAELIGQHDLRDVAVVAVGERAMGRVERHHEQAELHAGSLHDLGARRRDEISEGRPALGQPQSQAGEWLRAHREAGSTPTISLNRPKPM